MATGTQNLNTPPSGIDKGLAAGLEHALKGVSKLLGARRFYPPGHPALKDVTRDALQGFLPVLQGRDCLVLQVRRDGFSLDDKPFGVDNPMMQKLAGVLFARRVQRLLFLKDLSCRDLWGFSQVMLQDAADLHRQGGVQEVLERHRVSTIWVNIVDLASILERKAELEAEKAELYGEDSDEAFLDALADADGALAPEAGAGAEEKEAMTLERLLRMLASSRTDQEFATLLPQLPPLVRNSLKDETAAQVVQALSLVTNQGANDLVSAERQTVVRQTLSQLTTLDILNFYVSQVCSRKLLAEQRLQCTQISSALGPEVAPLLMARLVDEGDQSIRRILYEALIELGPVALPVVLPGLEDERWFVVRNAVHIVGEIREPGTVAKLRPVLNHADLRVRREVVRALTRIGGDTVVNILLRTLQGTDADVRRQAMLSLGAMKNPAAVPALLKFVAMPDWRIRQLEGKKDALRALGEIGVTESLPVLMQIAGKGRLLFRARHNELRAAAASAVGEIGGAEAIAFLEKLAAHAPGAVAKAATTALKQARKVGRR